MGSWVKTIQHPVWALEACSIQKAGLLPWPPAPHLARVGQKWWPRFAFKYISLLCQFFPLPFSKLQEVLLRPGSRRQYVHGEEMLQSALVFRHAGGKRKSGTEKSQRNIKVWTQNTWASHLCFKNSLTS